MQSSRLFPIDRFSGTRPVRITAQALLREEKHWEEEDLVQLQFVISGTSVSVLPSLLAMISRTLWYMIPLSS